MFAIPTPSTANARQQQFWEMLEEDFEAALWRLGSCSLIDFEHEKDTPWFCSCVCWEEDVVPEFGRENLLRVYEFIKCPAWIAMKLQTRRGTVRHSQSMSELWISRVKGTASMRRKFLSFLSFRTKVEDLIAQAGIKAPVLPGHRPRVFPWFEGKAMVSWKHMAHEAINIYTSAWIIILMDLGRHNKVGSGRNRQCRVGWKGCGRASLCRALSEARFGWIMMDQGSEI